MLSKCVGTTESKCKNAYYTVSKYRVAGDIAHIDVNLCSEHRSALISVHPNWQFVRLET